MSAPSLPTEILDLIFDLIKPKSSLPTSLSQNSLASLALTSKEFLSPARIRLYFHPLLNASSFPWIKATALADTLRNGNLGQLVVSLEGLCRCLFKLSNSPAPSTPLPYQIRGFTKAFSWYITVLQACPHLVEVDAYFKNQNQLKKIEIALEASTPTLRIANFVDDDGDRVRREDRMTSGCIKGALVRDPFQNIESIKLESIEYLYATRLDHPLTSLHLRDTRRWGDSLHNFQLTDLSRFHSLRIGSGNSFYDIRQFLASLAPALQHLEILHSVPFSKSLSLLCLYGTCDYLNLQPQNLEPLVNLTSFTARWARASWIKIIETLATSSPLLRSIDLHGSQWIQSNDYCLRDHPAKERFPPACPEPTLKTLLLSLTHLKKIDLGTFPTTNPRAYGSLRTELDKNGVHVGWEGCLSDH